MNNNNIYVDYIVSSLIGFAVGDAMGVPLEFSKRESLIINITEMMGNGTHNMPEGTWSDDTSLTVATMDSIINTESIDCDDIMKKYYEWLTSAKYTATDKVFDVGNATKYAISNYAKGLRPNHDYGSTEINSNGNGSLMRMLPIAIFVNALNLSEEERVKLINECSGITHGHDISKLGCNIYCDYIKLLLSGRTKEEAFDDLSRIDYSKYFSKEILDYYKSILNGSLKNYDIQNIKSSGFVVDTLEASLWSILKTNNYEESIIKSINLGEDTDTIGAIAGSISAIIYGYSAIPKRWLDKLQKLDYLKEIGYKFSNTVDNVKQRKVSSRFYN